MTPRGVLEELLDVDPESVREIEQSRFDRIAGVFSERLVLFGAGGLGRRTLAGLRRIGIEPLAFADNSTRMHGTSVEGCPVLSPMEAASRYHDQATFVTTIWGAVSPSAILGRRQRETRDQLTGLGCKRVANFTALYTKYPDIFLPYYALDLPSRLLAEKSNIIRAFELMADDYSRNEFVAQIRWRLHHDFDALPHPVADEQYFCDSIVKPRHDEIFVDCGAFDGDTLTDFLERRSGRFDHYHAFEPDPVNFEKLKRVAELQPPSIGSRISLYPYATSDRKTKVRIEPTGLASSRIGEGSIEVDCVPIDDTLDGVAPTTIKMDIEGAEFDSLNGARRLIDRAFPVLDICVYHTQDHLWILPLQIHSFNPEYRFHLRPHKDEGFDLVCYAVPPDRCVLQKS
jgi:FkbM family methyltransferase